MLGTLKGSPYNRNAYSELFKTLYDFLRIARRDGSGPGVARFDPHTSPVFAKYKTIANNHHVTEFICGTLSPVIEGSATPEQLKVLLEIEMKVIEEEHHAPLSAFQDRRCAARVWHRRGRAWYRDHDGRHRWAGRRDRS